MNIILIIVIVAVIDWGLGAIVAYIKIKRLKKIETLFLTKLDEIFLNSENSQKEKILEAKYLCKQTEGKIAAGAYFALEKINNFNT